MSGISGGCVALFLRTNRRGRDTGGYRPVMKPTTRTATKPIRPRRDANAGVVIAAGSRGF